MPINAILAHPTLRKTKLIVDYVFDFTLIGMVAPLKDYKLAWTLNKRLQFNLSKKDDLQIDFNDGKVVSLSQFVFETENNKLTLLRNKSFELDDNRNRFLLPELSHMDYFLKIEGEGDSLDTDTILTSLREVEGIQLVQLIKTETLKSKENLIF